MTKVQPNIALGGDHAGFDYKEKIKAWLEKNNYTVKNYGVDSAESADYPDVAHPVASAVEKDPGVFGVLICGSANGVAITANKHQGIRAAICWNEELASLARQHNNANILCLPARFITIELAENILDKFLTTEFEGGRHARRVDKISC
jgi:ribose 5-phosphate isomerase B